MVLHDKIKIFDIRVERPPHYDTFAEFHYAYHYGDMYSPYIKQDEPLKTECQHFLDCIRQGKTPLTSGTAGLEVVQILEASSESLKKNGAPIDLPLPARPIAGKSSARPAPMAGPAAAPAGADTHGMVTRGGLGNFTDQSQGVLVPLRGENSSGKS